MQRERLNKMTSFFKKMRKSGLHGDMKRRDRRILSALLFFIIGSVGMSVPKVTDSLLMTAYPQLIHTKFAQKRILPEKMGDRIVFRRYARLSTVPIPLVDGVTPPGAPLSVTDIKAQVDFYGNFVTITNQVELTVEDRVLNEASRLLAENLAQTIDEVTRDVLASTSSVLQCANGVNGNTPTELTKADIDTAVKTLLGNDSEMISDVVVARDAFGTAPVRPAFWAYLDTDLLDDLEAVSNFLHASQYPNQQSVLDSEWGATGEMLARVKPTLIDLEAYGESYGDRAQALIAA